MEATSSGATHLNFPIKDVCVCGKAVSKDQRQELVFREKDQTWYRMCNVCIEQDKVFSSTNAFMQ